MRLSANDSLAAGELKLQIGATTETVEVAGRGAAVVQTTSAERSALLDSNQVGELMARGRDVMAMLQILPGVINDNTGSDVLGQFTTPTMNGTRAELQRAQRRWHLRQYGPRQAMRNPPSTWTPSRKSRC